MRVIKPVLPAEISERDGLRYSLWLPEGGPVRAGVVILHGAGSVKENHYDYARAVLAVGFAAIVFDQRGHGDSDGPMDGRAIDDVVLMAGVLRDACRDQSLPLVLRGSSMGGYLALVAAAPVGARAVIAICPAGAAGLRRALRTEQLHFDADVDALDELLASHDLHETAEELEVPVLLLHAEGDEDVPVEHSRELASRLRDPRSRLIAVPGGHHRSVQHDEELQAVSVRFAEGALGLR
jgi:pimeloyl-ACP methyl ester carboxylesterase